MKLIFYMQISISQNSNFAMSLQYLKKEVTDGADFLYADKHQVSYKVT